MQHIGELAAFGTSICWTASAIFFERSAKRVGALAVNFYKVAGALILLIATAWITRGLPFPTDAPGSAWIYLSISGLIGFVLSDYFLFNSYIMIGSRRATLLQPLSPVFSAGLAFLLLGERMAATSWLGIGLVVGGIFTALLSRHREDAAAAGQRSGSGEKQRNAIVAKGLVFALLAALFNSVGLVFTKKGLGSYNVISGTEIRVIAALLGFGIQALFFGEREQVFIKAPRDPVAVRNTLIGTVFGPFAGVVLSLVGLQYSSAGTTSALSSLSPILIILPSVIFLKQRVRAGEVLGAAVAVAGVVCLFLL